MKTATRLLFSRIARRSRAVLRGAAGAHTKAPLPPKPPLEPPLVPPAVDQLQPHWFTNAPAEIAELNAKVLAAAEQTPRFFEIEGGATAYRAARHATFEDGDKDRIQDVSFDGPDIPTCTGRLFFPETKDAHGKPFPATPRGAILHLHGGGFTSGSAHGQNDARLLRHALALAVSTTNTTTCTGTATASI